MIEAHSLSKLIALDERVRPLKIHPRLTAAQEMPCLQAPQRGDYEAERELYSIGLRGEGNQRHHCVLAGRKIRGDRGEEARREAEPGATRIYPERAEP